MREILERNNPLLRKIATPVEPSEFGSLWLLELVEEMRQIMKEKGAIGIAAPQIGVSKRIILFGTNYTRRRQPKENIPDTILINPVITMLSTEKEFAYEGCLNGGGLMGEVPRSTEIEYSGFYLNGEKITKRVTGLEACMLQHEVDHLDGILFFDRVEDKDTIISYEEYQKRLSS